MTESGQTFTDEKDTYRDHLATIDDQGKRRWIHPQKPKGRFYNYRGLLSVIFLAFFFMGPFVTINGHPMLMFNILERKFFIMGVPFWPQDFYLFGLSLITFIVFIILFTAIFGRIFCGWICPQTVFMEMVFRKIEYWIEGDARQQIKLNRAPWEAGKLFKKSIKHIVFYSLSFIIGNTFLAYIIGKDALTAIVTEPVTQHFAGFSGMVLFSLIFYGVFAFFREQVCTLVCPYGRLQGVLLDQNSIGVHYDFVRGEPRGKGKRSAEGELGDCIDCTQCVKVCPTGIDIRNGTQLECVNCTACIDSCNTIMDKVNKPRGLIRYSSYNGIKDGKKSIFTPRTTAYSIVLIGLILLISFLFIHRQPIETTILRTPGVLYQRLENGKISNLYNIKVLNKTYDSYDIELKLLEPANGAIRIVSDLSVSENNFSESVFFVDLLEADLKSYTTAITIEVIANNQIMSKVKSTFIGPRGK